MKISRSIAISMASLVVMGGAGTMVGHQQLDTTLHVPGALSMEKEK